MFRWTELTDEAPFAFSRLCGKLELAMHMTYWRDTRRTAVHEDLDG